MADAYEQEFELDDDEVFDFDSTAHDDGVEDYDGIRDLGALVTESEERIAESYFVDDSTVAALPRGRAAVSTGSIDITDPGLRACLEKNGYSLPLGSYYRTSSFYLYCSFSDTKVEIASLSELTALTRMSQVRLDGYAISDLTPLGGFADLSTLSVTNNNALTNITPIKSLINLKFLDLSSTPVSDISSMASLTNLYSLNLENTRVSDLTPLKGLRQLAFLNLRNTQITNGTLTNLVGITTLSHLIVTSPGVTGISVLRPLRDRGCWVEFGYEVPIDKSIDHQDLQSVLNAYKTLYLPNSKRIVVLGSDASVSLDIEAYLKGNLDY